MLTRFLARRTALASAALLAATMWAGILLALGELERSALEEAAASRRSLARSLAEHQASSVRAIDISLINLREVWLRNRGGFEDAVRRLEELLRKEMVIQVAVVDAEGWLVYSRLPDAARLNFADRGYFQFHRDSGSDGLHISEPVFGRVTRQWAIQFTRPIRDARGRFAGLVVVAVPPPALAQLYHDLDLGTGSVLTLARLDGQILARSAGFDQSVAVPLTRAGNAAMGEFKGAGKVDGVERFFAFRTLADYPLRVYVGQSVEAVLGPYRRQRLYLVALGIGATALIFAAVTVAASRARERALHRDERERLMLELHDGCIQAIYAVGLQLQHCRAMLGKDSPQAEAIAQAQADLNLVIHDLRAFIGGEDVPQEPGGLAARLRSAFPSAGATALDVQVDEAAAASLTPEQRTHALRIVREAVSNVVRHAQADACRITLAREAGGVRLEISDNGRGLAEGNAPAGSLGLAHIRARARRMQGEASIGPAPGGGTRIEVRIPVSA